MLKKQQPKNGKNEQFNKTGKFTVIASIRPIYSSCSQGILTFFNRLLHRLFEDKVYLAVLARGINSKKNKYAQEDQNPEEFGIAERISFQVFYQNICFYM